MFSLTISLQKNPSVWMLMFKTKEAADAAWTRLPQRDNPILLEDDFGQKVLVSPNNLAGSVLEDLDQSKLAHIERALHDARTRAKANSIASADPALRALHATQGPSVLSPMNGGGYR